MSNMRMVLFKTGWMNYYQGQTEVDQLIGGGQYVAEHHAGHEVFNFLPSGGMCFGNVQPANDGQIRLENIDNAYAEQESIDGVTVVWCATDPENGGIKVCGWYKNATIYRKWEPLPDNIIRGIRQNGGVTHYKVSSSDAHLIRPKYRDYVIPRATQEICGFGQSQIRYLVDEKCGTLKDQLSKFIDGFVSGDERLVNLLDPMENQDAESNRGLGPSDPGVEEEAIRIATEFYVGNGHTVRSVETDNRGWDLQASKGDKTLKIEVKGLSGTVCSIGLTPNEYRAFHSVGDDYRLFIVTSCKDNPISFIGKRLNGRFAFFNVATKEKFECKEVEVKSAFILLGNEIT